MIEKMFENVWARGIPLGILIHSLSQSSLSLAEVLDVGEAVHTTEHRRDGHEENFAEIVAFVASGAGIFG